MKKLIIAADDKIPALKGLIENYAEVTYLPAKGFNRDTIKGANVLLVRTPTKCNRELLEGSAVEFIGTANIGFDHIDREYCAAHHIEWENAPACNADSVTQYILATLMCLSKTRIKLEGKTIGIVGVGNIGTRVARVCEALGMRVLLNDPPRARKEGKDGFVDLETIANEADIITFHTPMVRAGEFQTFHLANEYFFHQLKKHPYIINTARGGIIDETALLHALKCSLVEGVIIDCWENEPEINRELLKEAILATPHIAGFSTDGKLNATRITLENVSEFFDVPIDTSSIVPPPAPHPLIDLRENINYRVEEAILKTYDIEMDSRRLKEDPGMFVSFRDNYYLRREPKAYQVKGAVGKEKELLGKLGFQIIEE
ncbi:MAG: DUF3410 domain-containing protein [Bacteroidota bacterium]|nr:DUF3410 domain-containing protein [Bacteroidota bacterium]